MSRKTRVPFYNPLDPTHPRMWPNYTLVIPICAVGNIGQLASDLVISTLLSKQQCQLVGRIYSHALMPVVGPNAFSSGPGAPTTSTEVYESKQHKLVIVQQRTSYFKSLKHLYIGDLIDWIKNGQFEQVLVLTSSFAQCNPDTSQLGDPSSCPIRAITTGSFDTQSSRWQSLGLKHLPGKRELKLVTQDWLTYLPGSGLTRQLIRACERAFIPAAFLVDFCSEGINLHDCYQVVELLDRYLCLCEPCEQAAGWPARDSGDAAATTLTRTTTTTTVQGQVHSKWVEPYSWAQAQC